MTRLFFRGLSALVCGVVLSGCSTEFPLDPTAPTPVAIEEPLFTGTLIPGGGRITTTFSTTSLGGITLLVNALSDSTGAQPAGTAGTIRIGVTLGIFHNAVCGFGNAIYNDNAFVATEVPGVATGPGVFCASVYEVSPALTSPTTFEIKITHF